MQVQPRGVPGVSKRPQKMYLPIKRVDCKVFKIPVGSLSAFKKCIISGQLSKKIVVGCVRNTAHNRVYNENPSTLSTLTSQILPHTLTVSQKQCLL